MFKKTIFNPKGIPHLMYSKSEWIEYPKYYLSTIPQSNKKEFLPLRIGRINGTDSSLVAGHSQYSKADTPENIVKRICHLTNNDKLDENSRRRMDFGNHFEPIVRKWYSDTYKIDVKEIGYAVSKQNENIGCSADGDIGQGIIEIKCTEGDLSSPLLFQAKIKPEKRAYSHIRRDHFDQMQHNIAVLDKEFCDYIFFSPKKIYVERIPKLENYFDSILMPKYTSFIDTYLSPYIKDNGIEIIKP